MTDEEKKFWTEQFNKLQVDWQSAISSATKMATNYGKLCQKVDTFVSKKWYDKPENWIRIISTIIIVAVSVLVLWRGGYVKYGDLEFGLYPGVTSSGSAVN